jgi:hypothetical protein
MKVSTVPFLRTCTFFLHAELLACIIISFSTFYGSYMLISMEHIYAAPSLRRLMCWPHGAFSLF